MTTTGLSQNEAEHVTELLGMLTEHDLKDLAHTSTSGLISCRNKQDAIRTIIQHSKDVRSLLNRKKITKSMLFSYLHNKGVPLTSCTDKASLVESTLSFWERKLTSDIRPNAVIPPSDQLTDELAVKFASWFYECVNEPALRAGHDTLIASDFWNDAQTAVRLVPEVNVAASDFEEMSASTDFESVALFDNLHRQHGLVYSPNLSNSGVRGRSEPHGAVLLMACGTLHRSSNECVGVFEQTFLIIKDPISENWKIKKTLLILRSKLGVESIPTLPLTDGNPF